MLPLATRNGSIEGQDCVDEAFGGTALSRLRSMDYCRLMMEKRGLLLAEITFLSVCYDPSVLPDEYDRNNRKKER